MEEYFEIDKIKLRVSAFVYRVLSFDAQVFGFCKKDGSPNLNAMLNIVIPAMFELRRIRRENMYAALEKNNTDLGDTDIEEIQAIIDQVVDQVYFSEESLCLLEHEIWLRPTASARGVFEDIIATELPYVNLPLSSCLRDMLNEYCKLPQYKREQVVFQDELHYFIDACKGGDELRITLEEQVVTGIPLDYIYGFLLDQKTYMLLFDVAENKIIAFLLREICDIRATLKSYDLAPAVFTRLQEIIDNRLFLKHNVFDVSAT